MVTIVDYVYFNIANEQILNVITTKICEVINKFIDLM